jgi:DNA-binding XRE family transcriptional regulator
MRSTVSEDASTREADGVRLRVEVYTPLAVAKGYRSKAAQARWHGIARSGFFKILGGSNPSAPTAMRIAEQLGVPFEAIWERVA